MAQEYRIMLIQQEQNSRIQILTDHILYLKHVIKEQEKNLTPEEKDLSDLLNHYVVR